MLIDVINLSGLSFGLRCWLGDSVGWLCGFGFTCDCLFRLLVMFSLFWWFV